jgi:dTDP-4-dehydrorhamnose reductase
MIRPLITGSDGLLGRVLAERLEETYPDTVSATRAFLDVTDYWGVCAELERLQPTVVISCAAFSDVDGCELHPDTAFRVNRMGAYHVARACVPLHARFIQISTDYVFDGTKPTPYTEEDTASPIQVYGASKRDGETAALAEDPGALILRTSFLFGPGRQTFVDRVVERSRRGESVKAVLDWISSPTYTVDLAQIIAELLTIECSGILNVSNAGACSKFEFARAACRFASVDEASIEPLRRADLPLPAKRPERTAFDLGRLTEVLGRAPRPWEEALEAYLLEAGAADAPPEPADRLLS